MAAGPVQQQHSGIQLSGMVTTFCTTISREPGAAAQPDVDAVIDILLDVDLSPAGTAAGDAATAAGQPYPRLGRSPLHPLSMQCDMLQTMYTAAHRLPAARLHSTTLYAVQLHVHVVYFAPGAWQTLLRWLQAALVPGAQSRRR